MKRQGIAGCGIAALMLALSCHPAQAEHYGRWRGWHGDIRYFGDHDLHRWRHGHWWHGRHEGQWGWWWIIGGIWYFYPAPVYPYPDPYVPPVIVEEAPPATVVVQPPPPAPQASEPATGQTWYYCEKSKKYYPYISTCPGGWKTVPATPPDLSR